MKMVVTSRTAADMIEKRGIGSKYVWVSQNKHLQSYMRLFTPCLAGTACLC